MSDGAAVVISRGSSQPVTTDRASSVCGTSYRFRTICLLDCPVLRPHWPIVIDLLLILTLVSQISRGRRVWTNEISDHQLHWRPAGIMINDNRYLWPWWRFGEGHRSLRLMNLKKQKSWSWFQTVRSLLGCCPENAACARRGKLRGAYRFAAKPSAEANAEARARVKIAPQTVITHTIWA